VFELIKAGGWLMLPIILCSVVAFAILLERLWSLQTRRVIPPNLVAQVMTVVQERPSGSQAHPATARRLGSQLMKEDIEDVGRHVVHELERYLNTLGTIAAVSPLLGLLGTVIGMIQAFSAISARGVSDPAVVSGGIAVALITTAAGLMVAIPALMAHRYLRGRIDGLVIAMEQEALRLVEVIHGERDDEAVSPARAVR